jgi:tetratricopeptide (TPR) repeat protein
MLARIFTRLFYAAIFFALGVWAGPRIGGLGGLIDDALDAGRSGYEQLWAWAESTISTTPSKPTPTPAVETRKAPPSAPVAAAPVAAPAPTATAAPATRPVATIEAARAAHSRGDVSTAIRLYDELIAARSDDVALRGELGNVYWAAGRLQEAAKAYNGAALVLLAAHRVEEAGRLEAAVRKGDPALADDLARRITEAGRAK